jgi:hypothetical protein
MFRTAHVLPAAGAALIIGTTGAAQPFIQGLGFVNSQDFTRANAISADGTAVVGVSFRGSPIPDVPIRWTLLGEPVLEILERPDGWVSGEAIAASGDGSVVLVRNYDQSSVRTYRWDAPGTAAPLIELPQWSSAEGTFVTPSGDVMGNVALDPGGGRIARWRGLGQPEVIDLPKGAAGARTPWVDMHGRLFSEASASPATFLVQYHNDEYVMAWGLDYSAKVRKVSAAGTAAIGALGTGEDSRMWYMTLADGERTTITPDSGLRYTSPSAIAPDGMTAFGNQYPFNRSYYVPFAWTAAAGKVPTGTYFAARGVDLKGWTRLWVTDVSMDGSRYVGMGLNPIGRWEAFVITFPADVCRADVNHDGVLNSQDFFDFLAAFFGGEPEADFNEDTLVNSQDFFDFLVVFFSGC